VAKFAAGVVDTGGQFAAGVADTGGQPWAANISANFEFSKKFETALMVYSGAWGKLINEKNQKQKIWWHCPFNSGKNLFKHFQKVFFMSSRKNWIRISRMFEYAP
jgi:hypothetical protein